MFEPSAACMVLGAAVRHPRAAAAAAVMTLCSGSSRQPLFEQRHGLVLRFVAYCRERERCSPQIPLPPPRQQLQRQQQLQQCGWLHKQYQGLHVHHEGRYLCSAVGWWLPGRLPHSQPLSVINDSVHHLLPTSAWGSPRSQWQPPHVHSFSLAATGVQMWQQAWTTHQLCSSRLPWGCSPLLLSSRQPWRSYSSSSGAHCHSSRSTTSSSQYVLDYVHTQYPCSIQSVGPAAPTLSPGVATVPAAAAARNPGHGAAGVPAVHAAGAADAASLHPGEQPRGCVVAVAVSGGVDSAVSALLLQQQGYELFGVYMHNWDPADEAGAGAPTCTSAADLADAKALCKALDIPLYEADFVARYWNEVFETFLGGLSQGLTPNPDLACNSHIKFGALLQFALERGADLLATGHYARLGWTRAAAAAAAKHSSESAPAGAAKDTTFSSRYGTAAAAADWQAVLLTGSDADKDQSYFLAGLTGLQLQKSMFPVGHLTKAQVRDIAAAAGLAQAAKRSSAGICFIGRRSFSKFLEEYLQPRPGLYVAADSGVVLGPCSNMLAVTAGQKAHGLGGQKTRVYVVGKDMGRGVVHVAAGHEHPALYSSTILLQAPSWVAGQPPVALAPDVGPEGHDRMPGARAVIGSAGMAGSADEGGAGGAAATPGGLQCQYQARYRQTAAACTVKPLSAAGAAAFPASRFCQGLGAEEGARGVGPAAAAAAPGAMGVGRECHSTECLIAELQEPLRGVAPGQMFVMYDQEVCLGSATIVAFGPTLYEQQQQQKQL